MPHVRVLAGPSGMTRKVASPEAWPRLMRAETAARYVDEVSVEAFRRAVGSVYPEPIRVSGKGDRWVRDSLDEVIDRLGNSPGAIRDIADVL